MSLMAWSGQLSYLCVKDVDLEVKALSIALGFLSIWSCEVTCLWIGFFNQHSENRRPGSPYCRWGSCDTSIKMLCKLENLMLMEGVFFGEIKAFVINIQLNFYKNVVTVFYLQNLLVGTFHYIWRFLNSFLQNTLPHCFSLLILNSYSCCTPSYCPTNRWGCVHSFKSFFPFFKLDKF